MASAVAQSVASTEQHGTLAGWEAVHGDIDGIRRGLDSASWDGRVRRLEGAVAWSGWEGSASVHPASHHSGRAADGSAIQLSTDTRTACTDPTSAPRFSRSYHYGKQMV